MTAVHISIIIGSTRESRFSEIPAKWVLEHLQKQEDVKAEVLDLRDYPMPFYEDATSPSYLNGKYKNEVVQKWAKKITEADAFIVVAPEYNHSISAVLKNAFDHIYPEWNNKAIAFVSYGSVGGARAVEHMRGIAVELQMAPIRNAVHIMWPTLMEAREKGTAALEEHTEKLKTVFSQLVWWGKALKAARTS